MVAPIVQTGAEIALTGLQIFSEERRRHFSKTYTELESAVRKAEKAVYPDFTDVALADARAALNTFKIAYNQEFDKELALKLSGASNA